jgi:hypothetical protein
MNMKFEGSLSVIRIRSPKGNEQKAIDLEINDALVMMEAPVLPPPRAKVSVTIDWEEVIPVMTGDKIMWEYTQHTVMGRDGEWLWIRSSINGSHHTVHESKVSRV